jgi:hypothetical protein
MESEATFTPEERTRVVKLLNILIEVDKKIKKQHNENNR